MQAIQATDLSKTFSSGTVALQGLSLSVGEGEFFGILGPNGAGKTTLLNILSTLLLPDSGEALVLGNSIWKKPERIRRQINLCSGHANFAWSLTVKENLRFYAMLYGLRGKAREVKLNELLEVFSLNAYADRRFDEISTGTKQRLALAKSLLNEPRLLFLDEPTVGLDPDMAKKVREHIVDYRQKTGCTVVLTTHYMQEAQDLCERIAFIRSGKVLALGTPDELKHQVKVNNLEDVFLELAR